MAEEKSQSKKLVSTKELANFINLSERRVQQLTPSVFIAEKRNQYNLIASVRRYIIYLQEIVNKRTKSTEEQEKQRLDAEIKLKEAKAEIAQLDLKELKAEMLRAEDVQAFIEDLAATTKSLLTGLPGRLAMDLANIDDTVERSSIIEDAIFEVLNQLAEYEFTLEYYKKRVAERSGRSVSNDEESDED